MSTDEPASALSLLASARRAMQHGLHDEARHYYEQCLGRGMQVSDELAGLYYMQGRMEAALQVLDAALATGDGSDNLLFLRGLVHASMGDALAAVSDFDMVVRSAPDMSAAYFQRALARLKLERVDDAIADFSEVVRLQPGSADAWANIGLLQLRRSDFSAAIAALEKAESRAPGRLEVRHALANAHDGAGDHVAALRMFADLEQRWPDKPEVLTDHALCLLHAGQVETAHRRYSRAHAVAPGDMSALAGLYMTCNALGHRERVDVLMDYPRLLGGSRGAEAVRGLDLDGLRRAVLEHPSLTWEPAGRSTTRGQQSAMLDLRPGSEFHAFGTAVARFVESQMDRLAGDASLSDHPWVGTRPQRWKLQAWVTILHEGGHQTPHIHPAGWMSGVFYLDSGPDDREGGEIVFGHPHTDIGLAPEPREWIHGPSKGEFISFPSYFFHHTRQYRGSRPRISLAFDVMPL